MNYTPEIVVDTEGLPNDVWLEYRKKGIGGSDVSAIFNESPWTTARALYFNKIGIKIEGDAINQYTLDFGHAIEPFVAQYFVSTFDTKWKTWLEEQLGKKIASFEIYKDTNMYRHPLYPFMLADLDYRIRLVTDKGEVLEGVFECKSTNYHAGPTSWKDDNVPVYYAYQVRHYMCVMNLSFTVIACLWGNNENDYVARYIPRDMDEENRIIEAEKNFWHGHVLPRVAPALSENGELELNAIKKYGIAYKLKDIPEIKSGQERIIKDAEDYLKLDEERGQIAELLKSIKNRRDAKRANIICTLGDAPLSVVRGKNGVFLIENKRIYRKTVDGKRLCEDLPDVYEDYINNNASVRFNIKTFS